MEGKSALIPERRNQREDPERRSKSKAQREETKGKTPKEEASKSNYLHI